MSSLLDVPLGETKGDEEVTYIFQSEKHAKVLLENLAEMQSQNGLLTDVTLTTRAKDYRVNFHSMLLAACSPAVKKLLVSRDSSEGAKGSIVLPELTKKLLECFKEFIYKSEVTLDEDILDDLHNFAVKYDIDVLATIRGELEDQRGSIPVKFQFDNHEDVLSELFDMFMEKELTTTVLEDQNCDNHFAVHGPLIAAASPALKEALLHGSSARGKKKVRLDIPSISLADVIGYIYSGKVTVQRANAVGLLRAACTYEMPALAKVCCNWLISKLHTYDVVGLLCLCRELDSEYTENLEEESKNHIITNFSELSAEEEFYVLGYEDFKEIIQHDSLDIKFEEDVVDVVMKWIGHAEETRLPHLSELLYCTRLELTSMEFLYDLEQDPRIGNSRGCLQVIEVARQRLQAANDESEARSSSYDEGFEDFESRDEDTLSRLSEETLLADHDHASSASDRIAAQRDGLRDMCLHDGYHPDSSHHSDSYSPGSCSRDSYQRDNYPSDSYQPDNYSRDSYQTDNSLLYSFSRDSYQPNSYSHDDYSRDSYQPDNFSLDSYQSDNSSLDGYSRDSYQPNSYSHDYYSRDSYQPDRSNKRRPRTRIDGRPDMRCKENRQLHLGRGVNKNGTPDKRIRENRTKFLNKDGSPDMRCKVNKEATKSPYVTSPVNTSVNGRPSGGARFSWELPPSSGYVSGPLKKDGTPDMRCKVNREAIRSPYSTSSVYTSVSGRPSSGIRFLWELPAPSGCGPLKKDGTPDMRYAENKQLCAASSAAASTPSHGPLKKNGTPDMRYTENKQRCAASSAATCTTSHGPLKKNGTPDMRYTVNQQRCAASSVATGTSSHGPLKKNGTPDMRYAVNRKQSPQSSKALGPLKKNGTPDMRFKANKR